MRALVALLLCLTVAACADRSFTPVLPDALKVGQPVQVLTATSRNREQDGNFGYNRSETLSFLDLDVSIPPDHKVGTLEFAYARPNPRTQFTLAGQEHFSGPSAFVNHLRTDLARKPGGQREVTIFVHGFNTTHYEAAFRAAQLVHDIQLPGQIVLYSWPSRGKPLAYGYDYDSVLFARGGLEQLLRLVTRDGATKVLLVGHSMGSAVIMETLRTLDNRSPGWAGRNTSGVVLISPDLDVDVFRSQMDGLKTVPRPFVIFVSHQDRILNLSARLRGAHERERLGTISDIAQISDLPVEIVDTTAYAKDAGSTHFTPATSPALISLLRQFRVVDGMLGQNDISLSSLLTGRPSQSSSAVRIVLPFLGGDK